MRVRRRRGLRRWLIRLLGVGACIVVVFAVALLGVPIYDRYVTYPALARQLAAVRAQAEPVELDDGWTEYRAVVHAHSELSHDSEIPFPQILAAAQEAKVDAMFMTDHCIDRKADFSLQWTGMHAGVRFVRGWELRNGLLVWALPPTQVLDCEQPIAQTVAQVKAQGGLSAFCHTEEPRPYELTDVASMEIYNLHTDFLDERLAGVLPGLILNSARWPEFAIRKLYDHQDAILALWDAQNRTRLMVGVGAADAHQNLGLRATYTEDGHFRLRQSSGKPLLDWKPGILTRPLLEGLLGPLVPGRELLRVDLDPYALSLRYVNTHLLAHDDSEASLLDALGKGRAFVAFNLVADAKGFVLLAEGGGQRATLGESAELSPDLALHGAAPLPARWTVRRDGEVVASSEGRSLHWAIRQPGSYRVELALKVGDAWVDWIYANPIRVRAPGG